MKKTKSRRDHSSREDANSHARRVVDPGVTEEKGGGMETEEELFLQEVKKKYKEKDERGIPMSVREQYWSKMDELKEEIRQKAHQKKLGQVLLEKKLVSDDQLKEALTDQAEKREDKLIGEVLVEKGLITEEQLEEAIKAQVEESRKKN